MEADEIEDGMIVRTRNHDSAKVIAHYPRKRNVIIRAEEGGPALNVSFASLKEEVTQ